MSQWEYGASARGRGSTQSPVHSPFTWELCLLPAASVYSAVCNAGQAGSLPSHPHWSPCSNNPVLGCDPSFEKHRGNQLANLTCTHKLSRYWYVNWKSSFLDVETSLLNWSLNLHILFTGSFKYEAFTKVIWNFYSRIYRSLKNWGILNHMGLWFI